MNFEQKHSKIGKLGRNIYKQNSVENVGKINVFMDIARLSKVDEYDWKRPNMTEI